MAETVKINEVGTMYFLVDHENVKSNGYKGVGFLLPEDTVEIFYSECCKYIPYGTFRDMKDTGCEIKICKLRQTRKNALDFYITSRLGELIGAGMQGSAAIISGDHGFKSVQEYWRECVSAKRNVCLASSIAEAIISANEVCLRTKMLREQMKMVSLESEYVRYEENVRVHNQLMDCLKETEFVDNLYEIEAIFRKKSGKKTLYLDSVKRFGKRDGLLIYNYIKELEG